MPHPDVEGHTAGLLSNRSHVTVIGTVHHHHHHSRMINALIALAMCCVAQVSVLHHCMPSLLQLMCTSHVYQVIASCIASCALYSMLDLSALSDHVFLYTMFGV